MGRVAHDGRHVNVLGDLPPEGLIQQIVLGRGGNVLQAAHDVGDAHQVIVNDIGEVVGGHAVLLDEHHIIQGIVGEGHVAEHQIIVAGFAGGGGILADDVGGACVQLGLDLLGGEPQAVLVVLEHLAPRLGGGAALLELALGAEAVVGVPALDQLLGIGQVHVLALGLDVGAVIAADIGAFVPVDAAAPQGIVDDLGCALDIALLVGILNAQDEFAAHLLGKQVAIQGGAQSAQVHKARGGRRKSGADLVGHMCFLLAGYPCRCCVYSKIGASMRRMTFLPLSSVM